MLNYIDEIYKLTNFAILTPSNLLNNIKLENYEEIRYYKDNGDLICEMVSIEDKEVVRYIYTFDLSDKLNKAIIYFGTETMEIFNRDKKLKKCLSQYDNLKSRNAI